MDKNNKKNYSSFLLLTNCKDHHTNKIFALFENFNLRIRTIGLSSLGAQISGSTTSKWPIYQGSQLTVNGYVPSNLVSQQFRKGVFFGTPCMLLSLGLVQCPRPTLTKKTVMAMMIKTPKMMMMMITWKSEKDVYDAMNLMMLTISVDQICSVCKWFCLSSLSHLCSLYSSSQSSSQSLSGRCLAIIIYWSHGDFDQALSLLEYVQSLTYRKIHFSKNLLISA